jgi:hypothetical protein
MPNSFSGIGNWEIKDQDWRDSKQGINDSITALQQAVANFGSYAVVASTGDVSDPNTKTIYLVKDTTQTGSDKYQEYICTDITTSPATFELIGDTTIDLSQYYTKTETSSVSELSTEFGTKLDSSVAASTYLTQASADTLYYPLSNNPSGYLTTISGDFSGNNISANGFFINAGTDHSYMKISAENDTIKYKQCNQGGRERTIDVEQGQMTFSSSNTTTKFETIISPSEITISSDAMPGYCVIFDAKGVSSINNGITNVTTWVKIINAANSISNT